MSLNSNTEKKQDRLKVFPELGDVVRVLLYPGSFFVFDMKDPLSDAMPKVYKITRVGNDFIESFVKTVYPVGKVVEHFKNRVDGKVWVTIFNHYDNFQYSVPMHNVLEKIA
jgi:hypothetical protein